MLHKRQRRASFSEVLCRLRYDSAVWFPQLLNEPLWLSINKPYVLFLSSLRVVKLEPSVIASGKVCKWGLEACVMPRMDRRNQFREKRLGYLPVPPISCCMWYVLAHGFAACRAKIPPGKRNLAADYHQEGEGGSHGVNFINLTHAETWNPEFCFVGGYYPQGETSTHPGKELHRNSQRKLSTLIDTAEEMGIKINFLKCRIVSALKQEPKQLTHSICWSSVTLLCIVYCL